MTTNRRTHMNRSARLPASFLVEGLRPGTLVQHGNLAMLPLRGQDRPGPDYILLSNALEQGLATVTEVSEAGQVPNLAVRNDGDRVYANIDGIGPVPKSVKVSPPTNPLVYLSLEPGQFDLDVFNALSESLKQTIMLSPEYRKLSGGAEISADASPADTDDIPY